MGFSTSEALIGLALIVGGFVVISGGVGDFSIPGSGNGDAPTTSESATLNLGASPLASSDKKATTAYATLDDGTVVSKSLTADTFTAWENTFTNQDSVKVQAFDSSYYPIAKQISFDGSTVKNAELEMATVAGEGDVSIDLRETSGSSDNDNAVDVPAGGQATVSSVRAEVNIQDNYWNAGMIMLDKADNSNVSVSMPNAEAVPVPDSAPDGVDKAYRAYNPSEGEETFTEFATHDSSQLVIEGDDSNDPSGESIEVYVDDVQAYQDSETGSIDYGVEDSSGSGLGLPAQSVSLAVN